MSRISNLLENLCNEKKYEIEVSVKDAQKANNMLNDNPNIKFENTSSNSFVFKDEDDYDGVLDLFKKYKIEVL